MNIEQFLTGLMHNTDFRHEDMVQSQCQVVDDKLQYQIEYEGREIVTGEITVVHESEEGYYHIMLKKTNSKKHREIIYRFIMTEDGRVV